MAQQTAGRGTTIQAQATYRLRFAFSEFTAFTTPQSVRAGVSRALNELGVRTFAIPSAAMERRNWTVLGFNISQLLGTRAVTQFDVVIQTGAQLPPSLSGKTLNTIIRAIESTDFAADVILDVNLGPVIPARVAPGFVRGFQSDEDVPVNPAPPDAGASLFSDPWFIGGIMLGFILLGGVGGLPSLKPRSPIKRQKARAPFKIQSPIGKG